MIWSMKKNFLLIMAAFAAFFMAFSASFLPWKKCGAIKANKESFRNGYNTI